MRLEHRLRVPAGLDRTWALLLDPRAVEALLPGLSLDSITPDEATGSMRVGTGDDCVTYRGEAALLERDPAARRVVVEVAGRSSADGRVASATLVIALEPDDEMTTVVVIGDLDLAGGVSTADSAVVDAAVQRSADQLAGGVVERLSGFRPGGGGAPADFPGPLHTDDPVHAGHPHARRHSTGDGIHLVADPVAAQDPVASGAVATLRRPDVVLPTLVPRPVEPRSVRVVRTHAAPGSLWVHRGVLAIGVLALLGVLVWLLRHLQRS
jgi:carbon monoxide dehydrogenase subunit G